MAEGETKTERKTVEMSIWFVLLLLVLIIASALVLSLNGKINALKVTNAEQAAKIEQLSKEKSLQAETILEIVKQKQDGNITDKNLIEELNNLLDEKDQIILSYTNPGEPVSGEETK